MRSTRRLIIAGIAMVLVVLWGTAGYMFLSEYTFIEALYMTIITIASIGFKEVRPLDDSGRIFTMLLIALGTGLMLTYFGILTQFIVEGQVSRIFGRRRVERAVARLKNHYILCGAGRIGSLIIKELEKYKVPFVVIERNEKKFDKLVEKGILAMRGDASAEEILKLAGIERAKGLLLALASDAETVYTILSARQINPGLFVIARAIDVGSENKLTMAGANRVISPYATVSSRMVNAVLRPEVVDMLDLAFVGEDLNLAMEGVTVSRKCPFAGKTLMEANFRADFGLTVVGIKKGEGKLILGPGPKDVIEPADVLIVAGRSSDVEKLAEMMVE